MPELPEVRTVVKALNKQVKNKIIKDVLIFLPKLIKNVATNEFRKKLINKQIMDINNKGKFIVFKLSDDLSLVSHLRMEGKYHTKVWKNDQNDHISFLFTDNSKLIYNDSRQFGTFHLFTNDPYKQAPLNKLGKEPAETDVNVLYQRLKRKNIAIKTALLDQSLVVGLGNIYVNEVLWKTKVNPFKLCNAISKIKLKEILKTAKKIMDKSTKLGGSSINSYTSLNMKQGKYQNFLQVHTKENKPCPNCSNIIKKNKINGRGTYYCPACQK